MAFWDASHASPEGLDAVHVWSAKSGKYDADETESRWEHFASSPPTDLSAGTLLHEIRKVVPDYDWPSRSFDINRWFDLSAVPPNDTPMIQNVAGDLDKTAMAAESALIAAGAPLYTRGGRIVRPVVDNVGATGGRTARLCDRLS